jgi:phage major head subunit gpT-like protein
MKPFVLQNRESWKFRWEDSEATVFHTGMVYYGGDARYNIGMGHPALIAKVDNA